MDQEPTVKLAILEQQFVDVFQDSFQNQTQLLVVDHSVNMTHSVGHMKNVTLIVVSPHVSLVLVESMQFVSHLIMYLLANA